MAHKTAMGTTPFQLVYGLNAILPIEFILPTLKVAKELEWIGHELLERVEELESWMRQGFWPLRACMLRNIVASIGMTKTSKANALRKEA